MSETQSEGPMNANLQPGANYNLVGLTARSGRSTLYYIPVDATLALDQSISPQWSSVHTFLGGIGFGAPGAASMNLEQGVSLKYSVGQGVHAFYVDGKAVGQIDDPSNPGGETSLVSKSYVDSHGGNGNTVQPGKPTHPGVSIGKAVSDGTAATYMRSDVVLQLDESISPQWSSVHTFLGGVAFGPSAASSLEQDGESLKYAVGAGQTHGFEVGGTRVGVVDNPSSPSGDTSLVSKGYVDKQVVPVTLRTYIAISDLPLGLDDSPATTGSSHGSLAIGRGSSATADGGVAIGDTACVQGTAGIAIGTAANCTGPNSITLGNFSDDGGESNVVSIGSAGMNTIVRRIVHVADGQNDTDAATVGQFKGARYLAISASAGQVPETSGTNSVALGGDSSDQGQDLVLSIGLTLVNSPVIQRRIINVADGKAGNEAATFGQLQACTAPRLSTFVDGGFVGMQDGVGVNGDISTLENWPITSGAILRSDTNGFEVVRVAKLAKQACTHALTFYLYLNYKKIGSIAFEAGRSTGSITFDSNPNVIGGYWPLAVGDLLSLTKPHPAVVSDEKAQGLLVVINASVLWSATSSGN